MFFILEKFITMKIFMIKKKRVVTYINKCYNTDEQYREKRKEYCKLKMSEYYEKLL